MINTINEINAIEPNVIFVGKVAEILLGYNVTASDIDIVVPESYNFGNLSLQTFTTNSPLSDSGLRAISTLNNINIDIFIGNTVDEYTTINNKKVQTIPSQIRFWRRVISRTTDNHFRNLASSEINRLTLYL